MREKMEKLIEICASKRQLFLLAPIFLLFIIFFLLPLLFVLRISFYPGGAFEFETGFTLNHYIRFFSDPYYLNIVLYTLKLALFVVPIVLVISYVIAYLAVVKTTKMAPIYVAAIIITLFTNIVIRAFAWRLMLIRNGPLNWFLLKIGLIEEPFSLLFTDVAIVLGLAHSIIPYAALLIMSIMLGIDKTYVEVARVFGATDFRAFLHVTLPLSLPGVSGAFLIALMWCLGVYTIPALLGSGGQITMTLAVEKQILNAFNWPFGTAIAMILILFTLGLLTAYFKVLQTK